MDFRFLLDQYKNCNYCIVVAGIGMGRSTIQLHSKTIALVNLPHLLLDKNEQKCAHPVVKTVCLIGIFGTCLLYRPICLRGLI